MRKIILPEDDPSTFEKLVEYIYAGKICAQKFDTLLQEQPEIEHMSILARVYVAVDKYCMDECQNHVLDHFWDFHAGKAPRGAERSAEEDADRGTGFLSVQQGI